MDGDEDESGEGKVVLMKFPYWLKGALILTGLDVVYWIFTIAGAAQSHTPRGTARVLLALLVGLISLIPAFVVGAVLGLIVGYVVKRMN